MNTTLSRHLAGAIVLLSFAVTAHSANYYIDGANPSAANSNPGTQAAPWKTLYAIDRRAFAPGDIINVANGTYSVTTGGSWEAPAINIGSSGTQASPIVIRAINRHGAILDAGRGNAPLGSRDRDWITISGFVIRNTGPKGIAVFGTSSSNRVTGVVVEDCKISDVYLTTANPAGDNAEGIRVQYADRVVLRNNDISQVNNRATNTHNASGTKSYWASNLIVENNYIHDISGAAIYDKGGGVNNTYRYNLLARTWDSFYMSAFADVPPRGIRFHNNIVRDVGNLPALQEIAYDSYVYSNTFVNYSFGGILPSWVSTSSAQIYNNIFVRRQAFSDGRMADIFTGDATPTELTKVNYNVYPASSAAKFVVNYNGDKRIFSLASWRSTYGFDASSVAADATFVDLAGGNLKLPSGSALKGMARVNGVASGGSIDPGAYSTGSEVIGIRSGSSTSTPTVPQAPVLTGVE